ncbi:MAG: hypothetical protein ACNA7O_00450 [Rhodobacterales bacterium]
MPNEPKNAKEKRNEPEERHNAQGDHEGAAHNPEEFEVMTPQKQKPQKDKR